MKELMFQKHSHNILTRGLPKTGQVILNRVGDDGQFESGWWLRRLNVNNRMRFDPRTIGGDDVVLDRATGLMWAADGNAAGCNGGLVTDWNGAIDYAIGLVGFAGFSDWYLPNINQLLSIVDYSRLNPAIDPVLFPNTKVDDPYWSSTTFAAPTGEAWRIIMQEGFDSKAAKAGDGYLRCVRGGI